MDTADLKRKIEECPQNEKLLFLFNNFSEKKFLDINSKNKRIIFSFIAYFLKKFRKQ